MAGPTDTQSDNFDKTVEIQIRKVLEDELLPTLPHLDAASRVQANFVKGSNGTMRFLRVPYITPYTAAVITGHTAGTAPWLTEGVSPTAKEMTFGYEEFTAYQAGDRISITDIAAMESPLDLVATAARLVARQASELVDGYVAQTLAAGTNVLYAGAGNSARTDVSATDTLTGSLVRRAVASLKADNVPGPFRGIIHPNVVFDFEEDDDVGGWLPVGQYSDPSRIASGELGKYAGVTFFESSSAVVFAAGGSGSADVYSTIILGPSAYAFGDYGTLTSHFVPFTAAPGNELAQLASVGWKAMFGAMLIDEAGARYIRIESGTGA